MNNQIENDKELLPKNKRKRDKNAVAIVKIVPLLGCVSQETDALVSQGRKSRGNPMQKVLGSIRQASIPEKKGPSLGKIIVKVPHQRSPYAMVCPKQGLESCQQHIQAQRKIQGCIVLSRGGVVLSAGSTREPEEREFVVDSGESMDMVSKKDLNSAELETVRTSRSPTTVMTANGEVQTREEVTVYVQQLDLFVKVMLLEETPAVLSWWNLCEDHGFSYHYQRSKTTSQQKWQEN